MDIIFYSVITILLIALIAGTILGITSIICKVEGNPVIEKVNKLLPQTQCGQCGYPGCRPYAEAIANGDEINKCPPGGQSTINALAQLLDVEATTLNTEGVEEKPPAVAFIRESECIGCTKCIKACPVDAIIGAAKQMHTVLIDECTGCDLCVEPCPVDCIEMRPIETTLANWKWEIPNTDYTNIIATDKRG